MKKYKIKWQIIAFVIVVVLAVTLFFYSETNIVKAPGGQTEVVGIGQTVDTPIVAKKMVLPTSYLLEVLFQSQAPNRNWAEPYQNSCEEASIVMVKYFYEKEALNTEIMKSEIDKSVAWQIKNYGSHYDLDATGTLKLAEEYFGLSGRVFSDYALEDIKSYISNGTPVIAPSAGRLLGNPGFTAPGPIYHMLVIIGYDDSRGVFITNDPGVNHGAKFEYKYQTLLDAVSGPKSNMTKELLILERP